MQLQENSPAFDKLHEIESYSLLLLILKKKAT